MTEKTTDKGLKSCPYCSEKIAERAIKCKYCGEFLKEPEQKNYDSVCPICEEKINSADLKCEHCNSMITKEIQQKTKDAPIKNSSGIESIEKIPYSIKKWSWGAFVFGFIWGIPNKALKTLWSLVPYVGFLWLIVCGHQGRKWAWQSKKWKSVEEFEKAQKPWDTAGLIIFAIGLLIGLFTLTTIIITQNETAQSPYSSYESVKELYEKSGVANAYTDDFAAVQKGKKWGLANKENELVIKPKYSAVINMYGNHFIACKDEAMRACAYCDKSTLKFITPFKYSASYSGYGSERFEDGMAKVVAYKDNQAKIGYINLDGKEVFEPQFYEGTSFENGYAEVYIKETDKNPIKVNRYGEIQE